MRKTHDYIHHYRGYWSEGGKCRIRIYDGGGYATVVICSELPDNDNTSVTNMAEYLAAEVIQEHLLPSPLIWIEHYPEHQGEIGEYSLVRFSGWELQEACLGGVWRYRVGSPKWSPLCSKTFKALLDRRPHTGEEGEERSFLRLCGRSWPLGTCFQRRTPTKVTAMPSTAFGPTLKEMGHSLLIVGATQYNHYMGTILELSSRSDGRVSLRSSN